MAARLSGVWGSGVRYVGAASLLATVLGCGQTEERPRDPPGTPGASGSRSPGSGGQSSAGDATAAQGGSASGSGGTGMAGISGSPPMAGAAGCTRGADCAANIAVDDEIGSYCVTKVSGAHRCWKDGDVFPSVLPEARYRRVRLTALGLVGLTEEGTVVTAPELSLPMGDLVGVSDFNATNMWGGTAVCALDTASAVSIHYLRPSDQLGELYPSFPEPRNVPVNLSKAICAFEGLLAGVTTDGAMYSFSALAPIPGNDYIKVALSAYVLCGLQGGGSIACARSYIGRVCQAPVAPELCDLVPTPVIEGDSWKDVAVTYTVVCALGANGELSCRNLSGTEILRDAGPYTSVAAGMNVVCAIRSEGTTACFNHVLPNGSVHVGALSPLTLDAGW